MIPRRYLAAIAASLTVSVALADVISTKSGEKISGQVIRFERNERSLASSHFVIEVRGEELEVPLSKIDTITFDRPTPPPSPAAAFGAAKKPPSQEQPEGGSHWLSSTGKRHNSSCRYFKSSKGRPCGPGEGVACKICGG